MIQTPDGRWWGTAAELAAHLTTPEDKVTDGMIRNWARRDGLDAVRTTDERGRPRVLYRLDQAATLEAAKRRSQRGRPRVS